MIIFLFFLKFPALREFVGSGKPVWGTCAGLIFLANKAIGECTIQLSYFLWSVTVCFGAAIVRLNCVTWLLTG
jgi:glutamine amidotransferase PdxT